MNQPLARHTSRLAHLDIPGGGQIVVEDGFAYIGHMKPPYGTSIVDVSDPYKPCLITTIDVGSPWSHTHKVRVAGDIMITNVEQDRRHFLRKGSQLASISEALRSTLGREPTHFEIADSMAISDEQLHELYAANTRGYEEGGFKIWDISDKARPRMLAYQKTHGFGVHRFDMDEHYAYISTEMAGFRGNILVIYDISRPQEPLEVSRWWIPGQHIEGGEKPDWDGYGHRLHHALRVGDELWASVWHAGFRVIDISDITQPRTCADYNYHPWVVEPTHTALPASKRIDGRRIADVGDEEHDHRHGQPHAGLWLFDVSDLNNIKPLSTFHVSELDSPWARAPGRFGLHQFQEHIDDTLVYCAWFAGGLRIVDIRDPACPVEAGFYLPEPVADNAAPQSNDVDVDARGLIYLLDRNNGLDIIEYCEHA